MGALLLFSRSKPRFYAIVLCFDIALILLGLFNSFNFESYSFLSAAAISTPD
jgi:hypothetical protein